MLIIKRTSYIYAIYKSICKINVIWEQKARHEPLTFFFKLLQIGWLGIDNIIMKLTGTSPIAPLRSFSMEKCPFYTPPHDSGEVLWFHIGRPSVRQSVVRPSVFRFRTITSKHQWIFTKFGMCIDIVEIWFGIANGQVSSNSCGVICPRHAYIFVSGWWLELTSMDFHQTVYVHWYCGDLVLDCYCANFVKFWRRYLSETRPYFRFSDDNLNKYHWILTKLGT